MKLQTKMLLQMGGSVILITAVVILFSLLFVSANLEQVRDVGQKYATEEIQRRASINMERFRDTVNLLGARISTFPGLFSGSSDFLRKVLSTRFEHTFGADLLIFAEFSRDSSGAPSEFSNLFGVQAEGKDRRFLKFPEDVPSVLKCPEMTAFLSSNHEADTAFLISGMECWIAHYSLVNGMNRLLAVRLSSDYISGLSMSPRAGFLIFEGETKRLESLEKIKPPPPSVLREIAALSSSEPDTPDSYDCQTRVFTDTEGEKVWLTTTALLKPLDPSRNPVRIVRLYEYDEIMPTFSKLIDSKVKNMGFFVIALSILGLLLLALPLIFFSRQIAKPLSTAVAFADTLASGDFPVTKFPESGLTEIDQLMKSLNHMRDRLNTMIGKLKRSHERELEARKDVETSNRLKSYFLSSMSMEYLEKLNSISGFLALMSCHASRGKTPFPADFAPLIHAMKQNIVMLTEMGDIMRELSQLDSLGSAGLKPEEIDTYQLLREVNDPALAVARNRKIETELRFASDVPSVIFIDHDKLTRLLSTVLNALCRSTPSGGKLACGANCETTRLVFWISGATDNPAPLDYILYHSSGRALGQFESAVSVIKLTLARYLAHVLGGDFDISCGDEETFMLRISFPLADLVNTSLSETSSFFRSATGSISIRARTADSTQKTSILSSLNRIRPGDAPLRVIVSEDDESNRLLISMMLGDIGCETTLSADVPATLKLLKKQPFDVLILNLHMRDIARFPVLAEIRQITRNPDLFIIVLAAFLEDGDRNRLISAGANQCLLKPVDMDDLIGAVRGVVRRSDPTE